MDLREFLIWLASSAGSAVALSFITERIPAFHNLSASTRSYIHLGGSLVIALSAYAIITYVPADSLTALLPWFQIVAAVVGTWAAGQLAHKADPARVEPVAVVETVTAVNTPHAPAKSTDRPIQPRQ